MTETDEVSSNCVSSTCRICTSKGPHPTIRAQERHFGFGDEFLYFECCQCGTIQIETIPSDLGRYYPNTYYSFDESVAKGSEQVGPLRRYLRATRAGFKISGKGTLGRFISKWNPDYFPYPWKWFGLTGVDVRSQILDVGCGGGSLLRAMRENGFENLFGVDPFIPKTVNETNLHITKGEIFDLEQKFDLIMFHHSLEHVPDPKAHLMSAAKLCRPGGAILVRLPIADGYGWRTFRELWFALDAPRHLVIPTRKALTLLGSSVGLDLAHVECDAEAVCFWGSELYRRGIPAVQKDGRQTIDSASPFSTSEMIDFRRRARELNEADDGDIACFIFRAP